MSVESARKFLSGAWQDKKFQAQLMELGSLEENAASTGLVALAKSAGFDFSKEEFRMATLSSNAQAMTARSGNALVRLRNRVRDLKSPDWVMLRADLYSAQEYLFGVETRMEIRRHLLRDVPGGAAVLRALKKSCSNSLKALCDMEIAVDAQNPPGLKRSFTILAQATDELFAALRVARELSAELPVFFDLAELNEFFLVAIKVLKDDSAEVEGLAANLRPLYAWSLGLDPTIKNLQENHPEEKELLEAVLRSRGLVTEGLGGVVVFLESKDKSDLSMALSLLEKGMRTLAPALSVIRELRDRSCEFSQEPLLDSVFRAAGEWAQGKVEHPQILVALQALLQAHVYDMELAHQDSFLPLSTHRELFSRIGETHSIMTSLLMALVHQKQPDRFLEDLEAFRRNGSEFDALCRQLKALDRPMLSGSPNFQKLFNTMEQVYLEEVPDDRLRDFLPFLRSSQEDFLQRLSRVAHPTEEHDLARECLEEHRRGFEELEGYLLDGSRSHILGALELLLPACMDLEELDHMFATNSSEIGIDILEGEPVLNQSRALQQIKAIVEASRSGALTGEECLAGLRSSVEHMEHAFKALNSQIRPLILGKSDQEALLHYEQLSVILEYQLNGLQWLEKILLSGTPAEIDDAVQELTEVDAYLLAFQEDIQKLEGVT
jgi:predicted ribosomally synthesized peptide with nif11-like leader